MTMLHGTTDNVYIKDNFDIHKTIVGILFLELILHEKEKRPLITNNIKHALDGTNCITEQLVDEANK